MIAEVHWLGKFRGPEFAPLSFQLQPGTTDKLKDSKGRPVWTVTARPLERTERAEKEKTHARNEDRLLKLIVTFPYYSMTDMAQALQWFYANGDPDKSRVRRVLQALEADHLVKKEGGRYKPTRAGTAKAESIILDRPFADVEETPF
jgi:hypothetical protein